MSWTKEWTRSCGGVEERSWRRGAETGEKWNLSNSAPEFLGEAELDAGHFPSRCGGSPTQPRPRHRLLRRVRVESVFLLWVILQVGVSLPSEMEFRVAVGTSWLCCPAAVLANVYLSSSIIDYSMRRQADLQVSLWAHATTQVFSSLDQPAIHLSTCRLTIMGRDSDRLYL